MMFGDIGRLPKSEKGPIGLEKYLQKLNRPDPLIICKLRCSN